MTVTAARVMAVIMVSIITSVIATVVAVIAIVCIASVTYSVFKPFNFGVVFKQYICKQKPCRIVQNRTAAAAVL